MSRITFLKHSGKPDFGLLLTAGGALFLLFWLFTLAALPVRAATTVGNGTAASCTETSLDNALALGGVINFNCGSDSYNFPITSRKNIALNTTLDGTGPGIIFDYGYAGASPQGMFFVNSNITFTVVNLGFINGKSTDNGAAIYANGNSNLLVSNSSFNNNISTVASDYEGGGAIFLGPLATATITNSQFTYNKAPSGGAINSRDSVSLIISGTTFLGNEATGSDGGAIYSHSNPGGSQPPMTFQLQSSQLDTNVAKNQGGGLSVSYLNATQSGSLKNTIIVNNNAGVVAGNGRGGGIYVEQGQLALSNSVIYSNTVPTSGGGIFIGRDTSVNPYVTIENTTIGNNRVYAAGSHGGGIFRTRGTLLLTGVTVASNQSQDVGAGIFTNSTGENSQSALDITLKNSIVANNNSSVNIYFSECSDVMTGAGYNLQYSAAVPYPQVCTSDVTKSDPKLTSILNLGGPTPSFGLLAGSAAIDAIPAANCALNIDQRGFSRPYNSKCDIGAFEGVVRPPTLTLSFNPITVGIGGISTLTFSLTNPSSPGVPLSQIAFKDDLPATLKVAPLPNLSANCAGPDGNPTVTFTNNNGTINVNNAGLNTGQTCTISVDVVNQLNAAGSIVTQVGLLTYLNSQNYTSNAQATLTVEDSTPRNLTASAASNSQIQLAWQGGSAPVSGYRIDRSNNGTSNFQFLTNVGGNVFSYADTGLSEVTTYYYRVSANLGSGYSPASNYAGATTRLNPPANLTATWTGSQVTLAWQNNSTHQTGFKVERKTGPGGTYAEVASPTTATYSDSSPTADLVYYYRVRAVNSTTSLYSAYSNEAGIAIPGSLVVSKVSDDGSNTTGSLSYALSQAQTGPARTITFNLSSGATVNVSPGQTFTIGAGVTLAGGCNGGPTITIKGARFQLGGNNLLFGLQIMEPAGLNMPLLINKTTTTNPGNDLSCVSIKS